MRCTLNSHPMKTTRLPALLIGLLYVGFLGCLAWSASQLPATVATHFDARGRPNGWMSHSAYLRFILVFGLAFPLFVPAISYVARFLPASCFNLPNRDYWLAPEHRTEVSGYLFRHSLWFASLALGFVVGLHLSTVHANRVGYLPVWLILTLAGSFLLATAIWAIGMVLHFKHIPSPVK